MSSLAGVPKPDVPPPPPTAAERLLLGQQRVLEQIAVGAPLLDVLNAITKLVEAQEPGIWCSILLLDESGQRLRTAAAPSLPQAFTAAIDGLEIGPEQGACGAAAHLNSRVIVEDTFIDPRTAAFIELAQRYSLRSCWSEPIRSREGTVLGTFAIYSSKPGTPNDMHVRFIETSARLAGIALDRNRAERALRASEYRYQTLAELSPVGIYRADANGQTVYVNPRGLELLGQSLEQARGAGWVNALHPDDAQRVRQHWRDRIGSPHPSLSEFRVIKPGEEPTWIIAQSRPEFDEAGKIVAYVGTFTDISHRKQEELELAQARDAAQAASGAKDRFLAVLSHELRTPLAPVLATVRMVEMRPDLPADLRGDVEMIRRNLEIETRLIDDLLDLTRISRGKMELRLEPVDAHAALQSALEICRGDADAKQITIDLDLSAERHHVRADWSRLQQVFWNLISNAIKFTPSAGRVTLRSRNESPNSITVRVIDTGIGIPPEMLPRLFSAFEQGERAITRQFGGLGLGLTICKALAELHGGQLVASSAGANEGAVFALTLPTI